jgi:hypothetical protein
MSVSSKWNGDNKKFIRTPNCVAGVLAYTSLSSLIHSAKWRRLRQLRSSRERLGNYSAF